MYLPSGRLSIIYHIIAVITIKIATVHGIGLNDSVPKYVKPSGKFPPGMPFAKIKAIQKLQCVEKALQLFFNI